MKRFIIILLMSVAVQQYVISANPSWMSRVPDETFVSQLSIPGAHDAATGHGTSSDTFGRTQDLTLSEMWEAGVRAFDLRPCVDGDKLAINHGVLSTKISFEDAVTTLCALLDSNPTELAIIIMRHETEGDDNSSKWSQLMTTQLTTEPVKSHAIIFTPLLTMGQARGKLLILSRDEYRTSPVGGYIKDWKFSDDFNNQKGGTIKGRSTTPCYIQDFYEVTASGAVAKKTNSVARMLQFSCTENTNPNIWVINHTSGYSKTFPLIGTAYQDGYRDNAATQNAAVIEYLKQNAGATGLVMMDFAGSNRSGSYDVKGLDLTEALVANNFREGNHTAYFRAIANIKNSSKRSITTMVGTKKYYLTTTGTLSSDPIDAGVFTFTRLTGGTYYWGFRFREAYFTNPPVGGNPTLHTGHLETNEAQKRADWEAQVFLLGTDGRYAVRATNAAASDSGWGVNANTFWTVNTANRLAPLAEYSLQPSYVWSIEEPPVFDALLSPTENGRFSALPRQIYSLSGQQVTPSYRGLRIIGGRKILLK